MAPVGLPVSPFNGLATKSPSVQHTPVPETRSTSVTHGNVSTEMAAVIALIAFMVGVVVTGSMWFIHVKTGEYSLEIGHYLDCYLGVQKIGQLGSSKWRVYNSRLQDLVSNHAGIQIKVIAEHV